MLNALISTIPYDHWRADTESIFHIILHLTFKKIGVDVQSEVHSSNVTGYLDRIQWLLSRDCWLLTAVNLQKSHRSPDILTCYHSIISKMSKKQSLVSTSAEKVRPSSNSLMNTGFEQAADIDHYKRQGSYFLCFRLTLLYVPIMCKKSHNWRITL